MNIVYVANDAYAPCLGTGLWSLLFHHRDESELKIYIISTGIGEKNMRCLKKTGKAFEREIEFIDFSDISTRFADEPDTSRFDIAALGRFFLGELLPPEVEKVLYLDCDTLVLGKLTGLSCVSLGRHVLAAVMEPTIYEGVREDIGLYPAAPYFNSGVLWIDLKKWRRENIGEKLSAYLVSIQKRSLFPDQDAINGLLAGRILPLAPSYNFFTNYRYYSYEALVRRDENYKKTGRAAFERAKRQPLVLHFAGEDRPWFRGCLSPYRKVYRAYRNKTLWKDEKPIPGKEIRLFFYHGMNVLTRFFPKIRENIGQTYFKNMKRRKDGAK